MGRLGRSLGFPHDWVLLRQDSHQVPLLSFCQWGCEKAAIHQLYLTTFYKCKVVMWPHLYVRIDMHCTMFNMFTQLSMGEMSSWKYIGDEVLCHAVENHILNDVKWSSSTVRWREPFFILCVIGGGISRTVHPVMDSLLHFQVVRPIHYVPTDFHWAIGIILTCTTCTRFWFNSMYFFLDIVNIWVFSLNIVYYVEMVVCVR